MHGIDFEPGATKRDLEMIIASEDQTKFKNTEPDTEIKKNV